MAVTAPRKRKPSKRKTKAKRRRPSLLLIVGVAALVAGFLVRRSLLPSAMYRMTHREPDHQSAPASYDELNDRTRASDRPPVIEEVNKSAGRAKPGIERPPTMTSKIDTPAKSTETNPNAAPDASTAPANPAQNKEGEHISTSDREHLDSILKRKAN